MPVQRSTMKNRGLPSNNRRPYSSILSAFRLAILFTTMAAAVFSRSDVSAAADVSFDAKQESDAEPEELRGESRQTENPKHGRLILEDPEEEKRYAEYDAAVGNGFSITFIHSVNKSPETDFFEIRDDGIYGVKTVYYGFGAGVPTELEEGQKLTYGEDGSMIISGIDVKLNNLIYMVGTVYDHILTLDDGTEINLRELCGRSARVAFRFEADGEEVTPDS